MIIAFHSAISFIMVFLFLNIGMINPEMGLFRCYAFSLIIFISYFSFIFLFTGEKIKDSFRYSFLALIPITLVALFYFFILYCVRLMFGDETIIEILLSAMFSLSFLAFYFAFFIGEDMDFLTMCDNSNTSAPMSILTKEDKKELKKIFKKEIKKQNEQQY